MSETTDQVSKSPNLEEAREHFRTARRAMRKSMQAWIPAGYLENRRAARKEMLLGLRKILDAAIEHVEKQQSKI